jgi:hypothetical protein
MDIWFALFVTVVAIAAAVGFSLLLVGYINFLPAGFAAGRNWMWALAIIPSAIVAIPAAVVFMLAPFVQLMPVGTLARWLAVPAVAIHVLTGVRFFAVHWQDNVKTGKQLIVGLLLLLVAVGLLYGAGPLFAERIVAGVK